jgi:hypothetical protein
MLEHNFPSNLISKRLKFLLSSQNFHRNFFSLYCGELETNSTGKNVCNKNRQVEVLNGKSLHDKRRNLEKKLKIKHKPEVNSNDCKANRKHKSGFAGDQVATKRNMSPSRGKQNQLSKRKAIY